ncbi:excinuclease ABC subunit A [Pseudocolwellia agarivorans]|uniref:excinuclease ABC subunit A n=1 Tax=Pseudocolwellia agarivorans TaxID=1911682 RepID=UPI00158C4150|nr:excinuclease ABC subunit A [Pseudocolwellia agarivorans]
MNISKLVIASVAALILTSSAQARDDRNRYDIQSLLESEKAKKALLDVPLHFAENSPTKFESKYGEVSTNKKTNAFMKSDQEACEWAMLSALKALQERAVREGMTDVINITSNYKNQPFSSPTEFECGSGAVMAGVALKGTLVKIAK